MAIEILVSNIEGPDGREPGCVVDVRECVDGATVAWGAKQRPPNFFVIHVEGKAMADVQWLKDGINYCEFAPAEGVRPAQPIYKTRSLYRVSLDDFSDADVDELLDNDRVTMSWDDVSGKVRDARRQRLLSAAEVNAKVEKARRKKDAT